MGLNKQKGNMYGFITDTWNTIKGKCYHDCSYCYMKRWGELKPVRFDEKELKTDLGKDNFIFVGSSCDMFNEKIEYEWIARTLDHCCSFKNKYLFQSKNPMRFIEFEFYPEDTIFATTIESNFNHDNNNAPKISDRVNGIKECKDILDFKTMITIEPIMNFNLDGLLELIKIANPDYINIGAVTGGHNLPEPSKGKVKELIKELSTFNLELKTNLNRILK